MAGFVSPRLGIRFDPGKGPDNLKIFGPDGTQFLTFTDWVENSKAEQQRANTAEERAREQSRLALSERRRADEERQRADEERQRARAADERTARLAARLRELGIEPE